MLYDLFRETRMAACTRCGDEFPECDLMPLDGHFVCENCIKDKCDEHADELREDFIAAHEAEFYLDYWWAYLPQEDRLRLAKQAYQAEAGEVGLPELEGDFCVDHEDWLSFAEGELEG